jgi:hypothetical protein
MSTACDISKARWHRYALDVVGGKVVACKQVIQTCQRYLDDLNDDRFELRITHTCDVPYPDEGRSISIALLSRLYTPVAKSAGEQLLTLALLDEDGHTLQGVLAAASIAGLSLVRIDSLPAPYGEDGVIYHPIFRVEGDPRLFECFLAICHPRARIIAKYRHLKAKENV